MSLIRRLWLLVIATTLLAFGGSLLVSTATFRNYLEQQLTVKNLDNATALALTLTQTGSDPIERELSIAAQFDTGHYELIQLTAPDGKVLVERRAEVSDGPRWLEKLVPLRAKPGIAQVSAGWMQIGTLTVASHSRYAYASLWRGAVSLAAWFAIAGLITGIGGVLLMRRVTRPLRALVAQVEDIGRRRFVKLEEPPIPELRSVARAMNSTVDRLRLMFDQEAQRIESLRQQANLDSLTGLSNRKHFMDRLSLEVSGRETAPKGALVLLRVADVASLNEKSGREKADGLLRQVADVVREAAPSPDLAGRIGGGDFALLIPGGANAGEVAQRALELARASIQQLSTTQRIAAVVCSYRHDMAVERLLAQAEQALSQADNNSTANALVLPESDYDNRTLTSDWGLSLSEALRADRLRLVEFPVCSPSGALIHLECPVRMQLGQSEQWLPAASFVPIAQRLQLTADLDLAVVGLALEKLSLDSPDVAVNLAAESLLVPDFIPSLRALLSRHPARLNRLWMEMGEAGAFDHFPQFQAWCRTLSDLPCRLGLEHVGQRFSEVGRLHSLGIHYLKIDAAYIVGVSENAGNQVFLQGACNIGHAMGLQMFAEGVTSPEELDWLADHGFDGATGSAVRLRP